MRTLRLVLAVASVVLPAGAALTPLLLEAVRSGPTVGLMIVSLRLLARLARVLSLFRPRATAARARPTHGAMLMVPVLHIP